VTTPGGVPNLPQGALTLDTLASKTQDMSGAAMKARAVERFPSIFNTSTGLNPALDITPFGILTRIWAEVNSLIANADPADVQGPEDLPELVLEFIEGLPVVGKFVDIVKVLLGEYDGDDPTMVTMSGWFHRLWNFLGVDFGDEAMDPLTAATQFISFALEPTKLLFGNSMLEGAQGFVPWPFNWGGEWDSQTVNPIEQFARNSARFFPFMGEFDFDTRTVGGRLAQDKLIPTGTIAPLDTSTGQLPDVHAPPIVQGIIDAGVNAIETGIEGAITHNPLSAFFTSISGHKQATVAAQASGDFANARNVIQDAKLAAQEVINDGGTAASFGDEFTGGALSDLGSSWSIRTVKASSGNIERSAAGNCIWDPDGGVQGLQFARYAATPTVTDTQSVFFTVENGVKVGSLNTGSIALRGRCNVDDNACIAAIIDHNSAIIGYYLPDVDGNPVFTAISSDVGMTDSPGATWELRIGVSGTPRRYVLLLDGLIIIDATEVGTASQLGADYRYTGLSMECNVNWAGFFATQGAPAVIQSWSASDRLS
jgi:hypothetical protein